MYQLMSLKHSLHSFIPTYISTYVSVDESETCITFIHVHFSLVEDSTFCGIP